MTNVVSLQGSSRAKGDPLSSIFPFFANCTLRMNCSVVSVRWIYISALFHSSSNIINNGLIYFCLVLFFLYKTQGPNSKKRKAFKRHWNFLIWKFDLSKPESNFGYEIKQNNLIILFTEHVPCHSQPLMGWFITFVLIVYYLSSVKRRSYCTKIVRSERVLQLSECNMTI